MSLSGEWRFRLDPADAGTAERWYEHPELFTDLIVVPGCWQGQGFGHDGEDIVKDFLLPAHVFRATYTGTGWYGREFEVPAAWQGRRLWLNFGAAHPSAEVWVNGVRVGDNDLPFVPFGFDISTAVRSGERNTVAVRIHEHNRIFGYIFNWEGNWSGLYRDVELTATGEAFIESCAIYPDAESGTMRFRVKLGGPVNGLVLQVAAGPIGEEAPSYGLETPVGEGELELTLPVPSPRLWCPEAPALYRVDLTLRRGEEVLDAWSERTGFVKLTAEGRQLCINDQPYYWLGSGDHMACPETGCPDWDRDRWRRKLRTLRDYGYNYVRCPAFVYTPEYFDAADEVGLLVQSEPGGIGPWGGHTPWHSYSWPQPTPDNYPTMKRQWDLCVWRDVNHPSANLYCMSNEFGGDTGFSFPRIAWECYHTTRAIKPTSLVIWTDGDYDKDMPGDFVNDEAYLNKEIDKPLIQHEFRWWSSFPDVRIMHKYAGAMRPYAAEIALRAAKRWGLAHLLPEAAVVSQRLQFLEAKGKLEMLRRDYPRLAGINHFNGADVGASPQGIVDQFYERKYADAALWRRTNGETVVLSGLNFDDRVLTAGATFRCTLSVSDYSHPPLSAPVLDWRFVAAGGEIAAGQIRYLHRSFNTFVVGEIEVRVPVLANPAAAQLEVRLAEGDRAFTNAWDLWILPPDAPLPEGAAIYGTPQYSWLKDWSDIPTASSLPTTNGPRAVLTERLDASLVKYMRAGGRVILAATEGLIRPHPLLFPTPPYYAGIKYFFTPPANYPTYEDGQNGTIIRDHPMLGGLPHEGFADLQFFRLIENAPPLDIAPLGLTEFEPVIRVLHRYPVFRPLAYLVEGRYGRGGLILCALDLNPAYPEAHYLLKSICAYATGTSFAPARELSAETLNFIVECTALP
jgi:hypothetical protein